MGIMGREGKSNRSRETGKLGDWETGRLAELFLSILALRLKRMRNKNRNRRTSLEKNFFVPLC